MKFTKTKQELTERLEYLKILKGVLITTGKGVVVKSVITSEKNRIKEEIKVLSSDKVWNFNFIGGGWNSISAKTEDVAIKRAIRKYNCKVSKVDTKTFRVATEPDTKILLSLFH
tara:strand:+ start:760 stop:1101 length:342 start_codon:yes stop_codon:yes gene_type:complete